jgi:hypothetical protein
VWLIKELRLLLTNGLIAANVSNDYWAAPAGLDNAKTIDDVLGPSKAVQGYGSAGHRIMTATRYKPEYASSWALVVGINRYERVSPLRFACSDAETIAHLLIDQFSFPQANVTLLLDERATKANIIRSYMDFTTAEVGYDDRVLVYFAGHGFTRLGRRGEVGFLVPSDGTSSDLSTLVRWDDLTKNAELVNAKHMLFVMDACYGGLALTRAIRPGSMRFLKDMLQRYSRQVLTAGKANETVLDAGGPLPEHSIFTGHFIQALEGRAATNEGIVTANGVMGHVYEQVARDYQSQQTPHYGFLDGDGDFIFTAPPLEALREQARPETETDQLVTIPAPVIDMPQPDETAGVADSAKKYVAELRYRVALDDLATSLCRGVVAQTSDEHFPLASDNLSADAIGERLKRYEGITEALQDVFIVMCHWGLTEHHGIIQKIMSRLAEVGDQRNGLVAWLSLRYYPTALLLYSGGIAAIAAGRYEHLAALLTTRTSAGGTADAPQSVILELGEAFSELERVKLFQQLPEHTKHYVPRSEYLFKLLQPRLDDRLFLGKGYESMFDRFEMLLALVHADLRVQSKRHVWGPIGRFGWKHRSRDLSPYVGLLREAETQKEAWPPLRVGLFGGSVERFIDIAQQYQQILDRLGWY